MRIFETLDEKQWLCITKKENKMKEIFDIPSELFDIPSEPLVQSVQSVRSISPKKQVIYSVDGICGSGKTGILCNKIANEGFSDLFVIAQPTKVLNIETAKRIHEINPNVPVKIVNSDTTSNTKRDFLDTIKSFNGNGCIITTHCTVNNLGHDFPGKEDINLFIDEIPDIVNTESLNFRYSFFKLVDELFDKRDIRDNSNGLKESILYYNLISKVDSADLYQLARSNDTAYNSFKHLLESVANEHVFVEVKATDWDKFFNIDKYKFESKSTHGDINYHSYMLPSIYKGYKTTTIMGADFADSMLYKFWSRRNVKFVPHNEFKLPTKHSNCENISGYYLTERNSSMHLFNKIDKSNPFKNVENEVSTIFNNEPFIYSINNKFDDIFNEVEDKVRTPMVVLGQNKWNHYHNVAVLNAMNPTPEHYSWIKHRFDISAEEVAKAKYFQNAYQTIMRTALRDKTSNPVNFVVVDKQLADWLITEKFPGANLYELKSGDNVLSAKKSKSGVKSGLVERKTNKQSYTEVRQKQNEIKCAIQSSIKLIRQSDCTQIPLSEEKAVTSMQVKQSQFSQDELYNHLKKLSLIEYKSKQDNSLMSGAIFSRSKKADTFKGLTNIDYVSCMCLDLDEGVLKPEMFYTILPDVKWLAFNSWSNGKGRKLRYRVMIFFNHFVSIDGYTAIFDAIAEKIKSLGYFVGRKNDNKQKLPESGLDVSKRTANSFFYWPCKPGSGKKEHSIWLENWDNNALDVFDYVNAAPVEIEEEIIIEPIKSRTDLTEEEINTRELKKERAINNWHMSAMNSGTGNDEFFRLAARLKNAGCDLTEVEGILLNEYVHAKHPSERRTQIKSIINTLSKKSY